MSNKRKRISDTSFDYIPWREAAYRESTAWFTSPWQDQIYRSLCIQYCLTGPLLNDEEDLRAICRMGADEFTPIWQRFWPKIRERFFAERNGNLHNKGGDKIRAWQRNERARTHDVKSEAGKKGAAARWGNKGDDDDNENEDEDAEKAAQAAETEMLLAAVASYNAAAERYGWPLCAKLSDARKGKLRARLADIAKLEPDSASPLMGWDKQLDRLGDSDILNGRLGRSAAHKNWRPDLDFILQEKSFISLKEGKYDNKSSGTSEQRPVGLGKEHAGATDHDRRSAFARGTVTGLMDGGAPMPGNLDP